MDVCVCVRVCVCVCVCMYVMDQFWTILVYAVVIVARFLLEQLYSLTHDNGVQ